MNFLLIHHSQSNTDYGIKKYSFISNSLVNGTKFSLGESHVKLTRSSELDHILTHHLTPLRNPTNGTCKSEDNCEHVTWNL